MFTRGKRVGADYYRLALLLAVYRSRAATTRASSPRLLSLARAIRGLEGGSVGRAGRARRTSSHVVARPGIASNGERSSGDHLHVLRSTIDLRRVDLDEEPVCFSLCMCIWTKGCGTRRSRSTFCGILALLPWLPPPTPLASPDPSRDPSEGGRPPRTSDPSFRPPPRLASTAPCRPRIDGPTDARFAVPSASVAATTGRGCVRHRTIRRQSIVIQFQARRILSSGLRCSFSRPRSRKNCPQCSGNTAALLETLLLL